MPVVKTESATPQSNVQFEHDAGPEEVALDQSTDSTGFHEVEPGDEVVEVTHHLDEPVVLFDQPGPEEHYLEGFSAPTPEREEEQPSEPVQTKVIASPKPAEPVSTEGAETK